MSSEPRSPETPETVDWTEAEGADEREQQNPKGFLGRLWGAISGDNEDDDAGDKLVPAGSSASQGPGILNLRRLRVDDVAIPKAEIVAAPANVTLDELVEMFREHEFSRVPIFRGTLDTPVGLVHLKDLALKYGFGRTQAGRFSLRGMMRPLLYVPPSMPIGVLLQQMQQKRIHMALVIDEYGGVDGLVTIEDLIEQVIGQIEDEHDEDENALWIPEKPGQWLIQARAPLDEVERETGLKLADGEEEDEFDTLGGLIFSLAGRVPTRGEVIPHESGAEFEVVDADPRRIKRVRLRLPEAVDPS